MTQENPVKVAMNLNMVERSMQDLEVSSPEEKDDDLHISYSDTDEGSEIPTFTLTEPPRDPLSIIEDIEKGRHVTDKDREVIIRGKWRLQPIYKKNSHGSLMMWYISYSISTERLEITYGLFEGKLQIDSRKVIINKSGKSQHEQSFSMARRRHKDKLSNHYRPPGTDAPSFSPMLANKYKFGLEKGNTRLNFPVITQPKLDGIRSLCRIDGNSLNFYSRTGKLQPHLKAEFGKEANEILTTLPYANAQLDGEVYIQGMNFSDLSSIIRNERKIHPQLKEVIYYVYDYDCQEPVVMEDRVRILNCALEAIKQSGTNLVRIKIVESHIANSHEDIMNNHLYYTSLGYEGTIIRKMAGKNPTKTKIESSIYKGSRVDNLLKHKDFIDQEGVILRVEQGEGKDEGAALPIVECIHKDRDGNNITTEIRMKPKENLTTRRKWFANPELIIGKLATYRFQNVTIYGRPRIVNMVGLRDYE
jgi:ATP-dependent DNA ligase